MHSRRNWADFRILVVAVLLFGACGYEPPAVGSGGTSSSSSSGMGGDGGKEPAGSVSSSGDGGFGGVPAGVGGLGGLGGFGGASVTSSSSMGGGGGMGGSPSADPIVQDCGNGDCDTSPINSVCCKSKDGTKATCNTITGFCLDMMEYALKCDDKPDCGAEYCCLGANGRASCNANCTTTIICKTTADCPPNRACSEPVMGGLMACGQ